MAKPAPQDQQEEAQAPQEEPREDAKVPVRLTLRPDEDWLVEPGEIPGLRAQGLLIEDPGGPDQADGPAGDPPASPQPAAAKATGEPKE